MGKYHTDVMEKITTDRIIALQDTIEKKNKEIEKAYKQIVELKARIKKFEDYGLI